MKVLFLTKYEYYEPNGIMSLSAILKQNGHECDLVDLSLSKDYVQEIKVFNPDIIAYSVYTGRHSFYLQLNRELKRKFSFLAVFGGPHATFFPEMIEEEGVDVLCRGEGEHAMVELANALSKGTDYSTIKNLWVKSAGKIQRNEVRPLIEDLDSLPFIDREIGQKYAHYRKLRRRIVLTGRGCPYDCTYCFNHIYGELYKGKGKRIRRRSVENVLAEVKKVSAEFAPYRFVFIDDIFIMEKKWCHDFCKRYKEEIGLPFMAYTRLNLVTEEVLRDLKDANCDALLYAIESGNDYIRNEVLNRNMSDDQIYGATKLIRQYGFKTFAQNMLGLPDETLEMAFDTLQMNIKCKPDFAWCSIFQPYPMTRLHHYSREKGYLTNTSIGEYMFKTSVLKIANKREIENLHHLFSITVAHPALLPLVKVLIKFPLGLLYYGLWHVHRAYSLVFKVPWLYLSEVFVKE